METTHTSQQLTAFLNLLKAKKTKPDRFTAILGSGILADVLDSDADLSNRDVVRKALGISKVFRFKVDYEQSPEQMIAAGRYGDVSNNIAKRFPIHGKGVVEFEARYFFCNGHGACWEKVAEDIEQKDTTNPWMPAKFEHVLSHGKTFPEEQRKFGIVGLGTKITGSLDFQVPLLYGDDFDRGLSVISGIETDDTSWWSKANVELYFLAVRKVSAT